MALKLAQDNHSSKEMDLRKDKRGLKVELKEQELSHEDVIKDLKKVGVLVIMCSVMLFCEGEWEKGKEVG